MTTLRGGVEKTPDAGRLRAMTGVAAPRLMALEVGAVTGAARGGKDPARRAQRKGCRDRDWEAQAGTVALRIPKLRKGSSVPGAPEPRRMAESEPADATLRAGGRLLMAVIQAACGQGIATRSGDDLVKAMGMSGISRSAVSRLCKAQPSSAMGPTTLARDGKVKAFLSRPREGDWPDLRFDAPYPRVRRKGRIVSAAVIAAPRVTTDGRRDGLGLDIGPSGAEPFRTAFLRKPARRGLRGVTHVVSDAREGPRAGNATILGATWQRCRARFQRNALAHAGRSGRRVVSAVVATAFARDTAEAASTRWRAVADRIRPEVPKPATLMDDAEHGVLACMSFPKRAERHSTNPPGHLTGEITRRTGRVGIVPPVGAILLEQIDAWAVQRARYMTPETIAPMGADPLISLPAAASRSSRPAPNITVTISASATTPRDRTLG